MQGFWYICFSSCATGTIAIRNMVERAKTLR